MKKFIFYILTALIAVTLLLVLLEVELRVFYAVTKRQMQQKYETQVSDNEYVFYEYDQLLGWKQKPNAKGQFNTPDSKSYVKINSRGLRDKKHGYKKPKGITRVLVLGDSFTWGYGVDAEDRFSDRLSQMLGKKYEVINAGVSGYGTDQEYIFYKVEGYKYKPDIVIVAFGMSDAFFDNVVTIHEIDPKPLFVYEDGRLILTNVPVPKKETSWCIEKITLTPERQQMLQDKSYKYKGTLKGFLRQHSAAYKFLSTELKRRRQILLDKIKSNPTTFRVLNMLRIKIKMERQDISITKHIFREFKKDVEKNNARFIVLMIPYRIHLQKMPDILSFEIEDFFKKEGFDYINPYCIFFGEYRRGKTLYFKYNDHWNKEGHALAAKVLYEYLRFDK